MLAYLYVDFANLNIFPGRVFIEVQVNRFYVQILAKSIFIGADDAFYLIILHFLLSFKRPVSFLNPLEASS